MICLEIKLIEAVNDGCYDKGMKLVISNDCTLCAIVLTLISDGADVRYADTKGRTPLHFAVTAGYNNIGNVFINRKLDVKFSFLVVKLLIANGAAVNAVDCIGNTPLHLGMYKPSCLLIVYSMFAAVCTNQVGIVTTLLGSGMYSVCVCMCMCACVCVHLCVCACMCLYAHACVCVVHEGKLSQLK